MHKAKHVVKKGSNYYATNSQGKIIKHKGRKQAGKQVQAIYLSKHGK